MKKIKSGELFSHLSGFLKSKGIELKQGPYTQRVETGCALLTDAVNFTQTNLRRAKGQMDQKLDQMRHIIHEKTAPPPSKSQPRKPGAAKPATPKTRGKSKRTARRRQSKS